MVREGFSEEVAVKMRLRAVKELPVIRPVGGAHQREGRDSRVRMWLLCLEN